MLIRDGAYIYTTNEPNYYLHSNKIEKLKSWLKSAFNSSLHRGMARISFTPIEADMLCRNGECDKEISYVS